MVELQAIISLALIGTALASATPVLYAALGETVAELSGVFNFGMEGIMLVAAVSSFLTAYFTSSVNYGIAVAIGVGAILGLMVGFFAVSLRVNQIVFAVGLYLLGVPLSSFMFVEFLGSQLGPSVQAPHLQALDLSFLGSVPGLTPILRQNGLVYLALLLVPLCWLGLFRTSIGMKMRAVGENPAAADDMGISVVLLRYFALVTSSVLAAIGGAYLILGGTGVWIDNVTAGRGFIAVAIVRLVRWSPLGCLAASFAFGLFEAVQFEFQVIRTGIPSDLLLMVPYVAFLIILLIGSRWATKEQPAGLGIPYSRE